MSEARSAFSAPTFNRSVKLRARDHRLSSNGGALLLREADERLGLVASLASKLHDPRRPEQVRYHLDELLRERLFSLKGAAFGLQPILTQTAWFRPHNRSEDVEGLYLVGAGTHPGAGMPGVISSAKVLDELVPDPVPRRESA